MKKNVLLVSLLCVFVLAFGQEQRLFTAEDLWELDRVGAPAVSPDGKQIVFPVTSFDIESNESSTNLYIMGIDDKKPRRLTTGDSDNSPVWSPDGKKLAFVSRRNSSAQLFVIPVNGGEARQITELPVGISTPKWFPDGEKIAFVAQVLPHFDGDFDKLEKQLKEKRESKVTAKVTENRLYKFWDRWLTDSLYPRIFTIDVESKEITDLMPGKSMFFAMMGAPSYDISPDGQTIAVSANSTEPPYDNLKYEIILLNTDGSGTMKSISEENSANDYNPVFSARGDFIIYGKQYIGHFYADKVRLVKYDINNQKHSVLTEEIDLSFQQWQIDDRGRTIYTLAEVEGEKAVFSIGVDGKNLNEIYRKGTNNNVRLTADNTLIFTNQHLNRPAEIYKVRRNGRNPEQLTFINEDFMQQFKLGKVEDLRYKGANDTEVQLYVIYPPDFDESKKYPMVMLIHGGPHGVFGNDFHYRWNAQLFAAPGYVVVMPNFHGSTSFGQDFAISIHGSHADKPYRDVMKAFDFMAQRDYIDETRVAAAGGSYGGYLVSWIAGSKTNRFAALINHAGVFDVMQQFGSDITSSRDVAYGGSPWENLEAMLKWSPAMYGENFETPMLIIHGQKDYRVPVNHAFTVYGIYKGKGLDARLVYFPDENHWILTAQNSIFWYKEFHDWLERYLK